MKRIVSGCLATAVLAVGLVGAGCSDATSEPSKDKTLDAPDPGNAKADSTSRRTSIRGTIDFGQTIEGEFNELARYVGYVFEAEAGAEVDISVVSDGADPKLWLYGPKDQEDGDWGFDIADNDDIDWPDNENAALEDVELEEDGRYLIVAGTYDRDDADYEVSLGCDGSGCNQPTVCADSSECGGGRCKMDLGWAGGQGYCADSTGQNDDGHATCSEDLSVAHKVEIGQAGSYVEGSQSSKDIEVDGDTAYTANMQKGVCAYDISSPLEASPAGCAPPPRVPGGNTTERAHDIHIDGDTLYVLNSLEGLWVYDFSDRQEPKPVGFWGGADYFGLDMTLEGDYAYLAARNSGVHVVDVSDPANPTRVGHLEDVGAPTQEAAESSNYGTMNVDIADGILYAAQRKGGISIYGLEEPTSPQKLAQWESPRQPDVPVAVYDVEVRDGLAYAAVTNHRSNLHILDVSSPDAPSVVWSDDATPEANLGLEESITISEDYVAVARGRERGILTFDRSEAPEAPTYLGNAETDGVPADLHADDRGYIFYAAAANTLRNPDNHLMGLGVVAVSCE